MIRVGSSAGTATKLQQPTLSVGPDYKQPFLPGVLVLDEPDGVVPRVLDVSIRDPVLAR
jgi:hypothetical protein